MRQTNGSVSRLERLTNIAFLVMCVAVTMLAARYLVTGSTTGPSASATEVIRPGIRVPSNSATGRDQGRTTLVAVLSKNCRYCEESIPFYRRIAGLDDVVRGRLRFAIVSLDPVDDLRSYLQEHQIKVDTIVHATDFPLQVAGTPTLVLVTPDGNVEGSWAGKLAPNQEERILAAARRVLQ